MSVHGPGGRYRPLRGTQSDLVRFLRAGAWTTGVPQLAAAVARPETRVWLALAGLVERGLVESRAGGFRLTRTGRAIRL